MAACRTTRPRCSRVAPEPVVRVPLRRASAGSALAANQAGARPDRMPVSRDRESVGEGKSGDLGGGRVIKKKKKDRNIQNRKKHGVTAQSGPRYPPNRDA